ncbi:MAG: HAMP domain-containing histidine kinase [Clostridia bacterium]|nr:HAMP domain-containing histidine kinase [Clostridia bacterium]
MIRKLQIKFVALAMLSVITISLIVFGITVIELLKSTERQIDELIGFIIENDGIIPEYKEKIDENFTSKISKYSTQYFTAKINEKGEIVDRNTQFINKLSNEEIDQMIKHSIKEKQELGFYKGYRYKIINQGESKMMVFLDCDRMINYLVTTINRSTLFILVAVTIIFIGVTTFSKKILKPMIENIERQRQFVTNAGHELKTPLAVIKADIDVLEMTVGEENEWITSIKNQSNRLNTLIRNLLNLANTEEGVVSIEKTEFFIADVIDEQIKDFKALLQDKKIKFDNKNKIKMNADIDMIKQLIIILLDNARKYTPEGGRILIKTSKQGKKTKIEIANECDNPDTIKVNKLFERFYREDKSRNQKKEGYGIGLSIAKSIVDLHNGKISAEITKDKMINFKIII